MSGQDLYLEMQDRERLLDRALRELGSRGRGLAQSEMDYRIKLASKILEERDKGTPVTIIADVCRGTQEIAKLRFARDVAEVTYKAALEAIQSYKLQIRILENQIEREWGNT